MNSSENNQIFHKTNILDKEPREMFWSVCSNMILLAKTVHGALQITEDSPKILSDVKCFD